jgi:hypothetical protein
MSDITIALVTPPGWTLATGGPHLALPLLAGALRRDGHSAYLADWNIEVSKRFGARITEDQARAISDDLDFGSMNGPYSAAQDALLGGLAGTTATWDPQLGYSDSAYDSSDPAAIREALEAPSPIDGVLTDLAQGLLSESRPRIIGFSISVPGQILPCFYAVRALRKCGFRGIIVLGGNVITRLASKMALTWVFDWVDALVVYQGELVLPALCRASEGRDWTTIPNLVWRDGDQIHANSTHVLTPSQFGAPDFRGLPLEDYWGAQFLTAVGSRGCYYGRCSFCSIPYAWGNDGFLGNDTPTAIVQQFETGISRHGIHRFKFIDEALHPGLLSLVADIVIDRGLKVEFEGYARLDQSWLSPRLLSRLSKAGLRKLYVGIEIAGSKNRILLNKSDNADPGKFLTSLSDHGILAHLFCMFGFPGTGEDDAVATVEFALQHEPHIDTLDILPFHYANHTVVPGAIIVDEPERAWALTHRYLPTVPGALSMEGVSELARAYENYVWVTNARWIHPVYRLASPWTPTPTGVEPQRMILCGSSY